MLVNFLKIDYTVVCFLKPVNSACFFMGNDILSGKQVSWIQPVCISINAVPALKGLKSMHLLGSVLHYWWFINKLYVISKKSHWGKKSVKSSEQVAHSHSHWPTKEIIWEFWSIAPGKFYMWTCNISFPVSPIAIACIFFSSFLPKNQHSDCARFKTIWQQSYDSKATARTSKLNIYEFSFWIHDSY